MRDEKKAVSEVIGVILMVAITVAIAAVVYVYVEKIIEFDDIHYGPVSGNITSKFITGESTLYYHFVLDDKQDVSVSESDYYKYNIGDFYKGDNK